MEITQGGKVTNSYSCGMDGQIATATAYGSSSAKATGGQKTESFIWDGLALLKRDTAEYVNEPAVTGGNPILANGKGLFNDMLGTTLGKYDGKKFIDNQRTSFGSGSKEGFFTGKPHVTGLGYAFLFRNYRSELGKWQTADPLGYPNGWNNLAYYGNIITHASITARPFFKKRGVRSCKRTENRTTGDFPHELCDGKGEIDDYSNYRSFSYR